MRIVARMLWASLGALWLLPAAAAADAAPLDVFDTCALVGAKLTSVSAEECLARQFVAPAVRTPLGRPILYKEYPPLPARAPQARVLLIGGVHGDEYASVSVTFKWMAILDIHHSGLFHWRITPLLNPDGLLKKPATRVNHNGVDLNRNMGTADWDADAEARWRVQLGGDPRHYPGPAAMSEIEARWLAQEIAEFKPDVIISVHAPYNMIDYDGPAHIRPPLSLGSLKLGDIGYYAGSLGNYAGVERDIPVLTIELASANYMPTDAELRRMWVDLVRWLRFNIRAGE